MEKPHKGSVKLCVCVGVGVCMRVCCNCSQVSCGAQWKYRHSVCSVGWC